MKNFSKCCLLIRKNFLLNSFRWIQWQISDNQKDLTGWPIKWQAIVLPLNRQVNSQVTDRILKLTLIHASVIYQIRCILNLMKILFRENSIVNCKQ